MCDQEPEPSSAQRGATRGYCSQRVDVGLVPSVVEGGAPMLGRPRRSASDRISPIGRIAADREHSTR